MHSIVVQLSEKKLKAIEQWLYMEELTSNLMPDIIPSQQLAMCIMAGIRKGLPVVQLKDKVEENSIND